MKRCINEHIIYIIDILVIYQDKLCQIEKYIITPDLFLRYFLASVGYVLDMSDM